MSKMEHITWTGGTKPGKYSGITNIEQAYVLELFQAECNIWSNHWKTTVIPPDTRAIFWNRARHDAHATFRQHHRKHQQG